VYQLASTFNFILSSVRLRSGLIPDAILGATALTEVTHVQSPNKQHIPPSNISSLLVSIQQNNTKFFRKETFYISTTIVHTNIIQLQHSVELI